MSHCGGEGGGGGLDFELNLAPIIDCFTVLITFMLVSATYLSLTTLDAAVAPLEQAVKESVPTDQPPPPALDVKVAIELKQSGDTELRVSGAETRTDLIARAPAGRDVEKTLASLKDLKSRWPRLEKVTLLAERNVEYRDVVATLEASKAVLPNIQLGGF
jgi:biopolymer transport protein ExbD